MVISCLPGASQAVQAPFLSPGCLAGCPVGLLLPPWCLPGASQAVQLVLSASRVPRRLSHWSFPASLVPPWCLPGCPNGPFLPLWCIPGCPNNSFLPPWCLPGASQTVQMGLSCLPGGSLLAQLAARSKFQWRPPRFVANPRVAPRWSSNFLNKGLLDI